MEHLLYIYKQKDDKEYIIIYMYLCVRTNIISHSTKGNLSIMLYLHKLIAVWYLETRVVCHLVLSKT